MAEAEGERNCTSSQGTEHKSTHTALAARMKCMYRVERMRGRTLCSALRCFWCIIAVPPTSSFMGPTPTSSTFVP